MRALHRRHRVEHGLDAASRRCHFRPSCRTATSAECPSFEIVTAPDVLRPPAGCSASPRPRRRRPGGDPCFDCTSTLSPATCRKPAPARIRSARAVSPCESSTSVSVSCPDRRAENDRGDDQAEPAEGRCLPVCGAPARPLLLRDCPSSLPPLCVFSATLRGCLQGKRPPIPAPGVQGWCQHPFDQASRFLIRARRAIASRL